VSQLQTVVTIGQLHNSEFIHTLMELLH